MDEKYEWVVRVRSKRPPLLIKVPKSTREAMKSLFSEDVKEVEFSVLLRPIKVVKEVVLDE